MTESSQMRTDAGRMDELAQALARGGKLDAREVTYLSGRCGDALRRAAERYRTHAEKLEERGK